VIPGDFRTAPRPAEWEGGTMQGANRYTFKCRYWSLVTLGSQVVIKDVVYAIDTIEMLEGRERWMTMHLMDWD